MRAFAVAASVSALVACILAARGQSGGGRLFAGPAALRAPPRPAEPRAAPFAQPGLAEAWGTRPLFVAARPPSKAGSPSSARTTDNV